MICIKWVTSNIKIKEVHTAPLKSVYKEVDVTPKKRIKVHTIPIKVHKSIRTTPLLVLSYFYY